jgi:hypothetical protein
LGLLSVAASDLAVLSAKKATGRPARLGGSGPQEVSVTTSQGHPRTVFRRAVDRGNLVAAELTARELGGLDPSEALELTALIALNNRERGQRYAVRWLKLWLDEAKPAATMDAVSMAASALQALGGPGHAEALELLRTLV